MSNEITIQQDVKTETANMLMNHATMQSLYTFAEFMASSKVTVPKHLQGSPSDCLAVAMQAAQWGMNPFAVAQKTHLVNGTLGYEAQLVNAVMQSSGSIVGRFHYEYTGEGQRLACRVGAIPKGEVDIAWGEWLCIADVKIQNSPLWKTNPKQQIGYLQVKNWGRAFAPGAILGVYSADELEPETYQPSERELNPNQAKVKTSSLKSLAEKPEQEVVQQDDQGPDFGSEPANNDLQRLLDELSMCSQTTDFANWKASMVELFVKGSPEFNQLVAAYNKAYAAFQESVI